MFHSALLAAASDLPISASQVWMILGVVLAGITFFTILVLALRCYRRCASNEILVVYGWTGGGGAAKTIHGGAKVVWPLFQEAATLSLTPIQIEVPLRGALSAENIRVNVPSVFTVAIGTESSVMQNAAIRLLGLSEPEIRKQAEELIFGQMRQVIASMNIEEINRDRDTFLKHVQSSLEPELAKIGLVLINVNITDITDESGYIDAIGQKAASQAIQQARGDVADQERMGESRVAGAERDKSIQVANARKEQAIGTREAERDRAMRVATLEKEQGVGEQAAAYLREAEVKAAEQQKRISVATAEAAALQGENAAQATIAASQAELAVKRAEAYETGEGRKREAEALVMEIQNRALARAALAEAERVEAEQRAKLEAPAKAQKARTVVEAEAAADRRRIEARAEADAIFAKLDAEARGQFEILAKKGDGLQKIVEACGGAKEAFQLLMLEHLNYLADASAKAISNIKFDKVVVWEGGGHGNGRTSTADFLSGLSKTLPPMMQVLKDIGGVELPEALIKLGAEDGVEKNGAADAKAPVAASETKAPAVETKPSSAAART